MTAKNEVTGDAIRSKRGNDGAYAAGWERIFGKKKVVDGEQGVNERDNGSVAERNDAPDS